MSHAKQSRAIRAGYPELCPRRHYAWVTPRPEEVPTYHVLGQGGRLVALDPDGVEYDLGPSPAGTWPIDARALDLVDGRLVLTVSKTVGSSRLSSYSLRREPVEYEITPRPNLREVPGPGEA